VSDGHAAAGQLLALAEVNTYYGKSHILRNVSLRVDRGEIVALLGLNGAGKTTTLRSIIGLTAPRSGSVRLNGREIRGVAPYRVARMGVGYVPEGRRMFANLTTGENLQLAERGTGDWSIERVLGRFPKLAELRGRKSGKLSGGEQEMLAIGRALVGNPSLLLVDEPSQGLAPIIVADVYHTLSELRSRGVALLLVEQNALLALKVADRAYVLDDGKIVYDGSAKELADDGPRMNTLMGLAEDERGSATLR
jgi:branched-chain amino acid transport system ATP-binding protein